MNRSPLALSAWKNLKPLPSENEKILDMNSWIVLHGITHKHHFECHFENVLVPFRSLIFSCKVLDVSISEGECGYSQDGR